MAWEDLYLEHPVWGIADKLSSAVSQYEIRETADDNEPARVQRLLALITLIHGYAESPHPALTKVHLDAVQQLLETVQAAVEAEDLAPIWAGRSGATGAILNVIAQHVRSWPAIGSASLRGLSREAQVLRGTLARAQEESEQRIADFDEETKNIAGLLKVELEGLHKDVNAKQAELKTFTESISEQKARLDKALNTHQESFVAAQEKRNEEWELTKEFQEGYAEEHLSALNELENRARTLVSVTGVTATASDYLEYAGTQNKKADLWRGLAAASFAIAAFGFLLLVFAPYVGPLIGVGSIDQGQEWHQLVLQKLGAPIGVGAIGAYCARESGKHRKEAHWSKQTQLTLTALEPFIANMPEAQKKHVRFETARRIFSRKEDEIEIPEDEEKPSPQPPLNEGEIG